MHKRFNQLVMAIITEELVRKRAEHNDGLLHSLEELSLHQLDIEKIENVDRWCPRLMILYLQGNLISRIDNLGRLKRLTYLNLAMNNISLIENLSGCESLIKLDLTLNFIHKLSGVEELKENYNLKELYLMGNPCAAYTQYRQYIITTLSQLQMLDGRPIERSERILASQHFDGTKMQILQQETSSEGEGSAGTREQHEEYDDDAEFWTKKSNYTPESRLKMHRHLRLAKQDGNATSSKKTFPERKFTNKDGRMLNINESKVDFKFSETSDCLVLDVAIYKYLDTSLLQVDVQPTYVRLYIKQKLLQLVLEAEVKADQATVQRSQTTGHLIIRMPKVTGTLMPVTSNENKNEVTL